jgi:hypothetical protein
MSSRLWPFAGMKAHTKTSCSTFAGRSFAACVITIPPMLEPTRIDGSVSASQTRAAQLASVISSTGVRSPPAPGRSIATAVCPAASSAGMIGSQHQAPPKAP